MKKICVCFILSLIMLVSIVSVSLADDDLLYSYLLQQGTGMTARGNLAGNALTGNDKIVYDILKEEIAKIAAGDKVSTVIEITFARMGIQKTWTKDELGVSAILVNGQWNKEASDKAYAKIQWDLNKVMNALLADCPYELYWYDKKAGAEIEYSAIKGTSESITFDSDIACTCSLYVSTDFRFEDTTPFLTYGLYTSIAVETAQNIVNENAGLNDYAKLVAYKNAICNMVSYNSYAANDNNNVEYGNPWQLIWVFDGDSSTNVVCEGYSKAFQYLVDLSSFRGTVRSYLVSGTMAGATGAGAHMWNMVTMPDGKSYLVDVTNCDEGTIGHSDELFMKGMTLADDGSYYRVISNNIVSYKFDSNLVWNSSVLQCSSTAFDVSSLPSGSFASNTMRSLSNWESGTVYLPAKGFAGDGNAVNLKLADNSTVTSATVEWVSGSETLRNLFKIEKEGSNYLLVFDTYADTGIATFRITATSATCKAEKEYTFTVSAFPEGQEVAQTKDSIAVLVGEKTNISLFEIASNLSEYNTGYNVKNGQWWSSNHTSSDAEPYTLVQENNVPFFTADQAGTYQAQLCVMLGVNLQKKFEFSIVASNELPSIEFADDTKEALAVWQDGPIYIPGEGFQGHTNPKPLNLADGSALVSASVQWISGNEKLKDLFRIEESERNSKKVTLLNFDVYSVTGTAKFRVTAVSTSGMAQQDITITVQNMPEISKMVSDSFVFNVNERIELSSTEIIKNASQYRKALRIEYCDEDEYEWKWVRVTDYHQATDDEPFVVEITDEGKVVHFTPTAPGEYSMRFTLYVGKNLTDDGSFMFDVSVKEMMDLPDNLTEIGSEAFSGVKGKTVRMPSGTEYANDAFDSGVEVIRK